MLGKVYDPEGRIAASGSMFPELLAQLNALPYYEQKMPKSLGEEWMKTHFLPITEPYKKQASGLLHTLTHHIAQQISTEIKRSGAGRVLLSGGGALNHYLVSLLSEFCPESSLITAEKEILHFKEALIFAFLGLRRLLYLHNVLASATGAARDHCSGLLSHP
jgi:anhydro-N-acetylmuramic acid kinase